MSYSALTSTDYPGSRPGASLAQRNSCLAMTWGLRPHCRNAASYVSGHNNGAAAKIAALRQWGRSPHVMARHELRCAKLAPVGNS